MNITTYPCNSWKELHESLGKMLKRFPHLEIEPVGDVSEAPLNGIHVEMCEGTVIAYLIMLDVSKEEEG